MYINKMIFLDNDENIEALRKYGFPQLTDYDSHEITADSVQNKLEELKDNKEKLSEFEVAMYKGLGEAYELLLKDKLDFIQVIY